MESKQNPKVGAETEVKAENEKRMKLKYSTEIIVEKEPNIAGPRFKPKTGRVFPARRRLVKSLILDALLQVFSSSSNVPKSTPQVYPSPHPSNNAKY